MSIIEPVRKQVVVEVGRERAFRVFTDGIDCWWPREHHIGKSPLARAVLAAFSTEVHVTFTEEGPRRTRVDLEHRDLERFADAAPEHRKMLDSEGGWGKTLREFAEIAAVDL